MSHFRTIAVLIAGLSICLAGCTAPKGDAPAVQVSRSAPLPDVSAKRKALAAEFQVLLNRLYPNYNDILVHPPTDIYEGWAELDARHPFLGELAFAAGPQSGIIQAWVDERRTQLIEARIKDVSVGAIYMGSQNDRHFFARGLDLAAR